MKDLSVKQFLFGIQFHYESEEFMLDYLARDLFESEESAHSNAPKIWEKLKSPMDNLQSYNVVYFKVY